VCIGRLDTRDRKRSFLCAGRLCHIYGSGYWRAEEQKMEVISGADVVLEMWSHFIGGHGPYTGVPDSVSLGDSGMPEACAYDAPLEGACQTCQTQANLRRWTG
jgi:hypothetical protein